MKTYQLEICKVDGTTPLGQCPKVDIEADNRFEAAFKVERDNPGYEVVSWGLKEEIDASNKKASST